VFNLGGDQEITIGDLAATVKRLTNSNSKIVFVPYEEAYGQEFDDMIRRKPDLTKVKRLIGYQPSTSLEEALKITIVGIKEELGRTA